MIGVSLNGKPVQGSWSCDEIKTAVDSFAVSQGRRCRSNRLPRPRLPDAEARWQGLADPAENCDAGTPEQCRGDLLLYCADGFLLAEYCRHEGPNLPTGGVRCARVPLQSCDPSTFDGTCEGPVATRCIDGYVVAVDCAGLGLACGDRGSYGVCVR